MNRNNFCLESLKYGKQPRLNGKGLVEMEPKVFLGLESVK